MKVSIPIYVVTLVVAFLFSLLKYYVPDLPFGQDAVQWVFLLILAALGVDVTQGLRAKGLL